jgi:hypothetical protein
MFRVVFNAICEQQTSFRIFDGPTQNREVRSIYNASRVLQTAFNGAVTGPRLQQVDSLPLMVVSW